MHYRTPTPLASGALIQSFPPESKKKNLTEGIIEEGVIKGNLRTNATSRFTGDWSSNDADYAPENGSDRLAEIHLLECCFAICGSGAATAAEIGLGCEDNAASCDERVSNVGWLGERAHIGVWTLLEPRLRHWEGEWGWRWWVRIACWRYWKLSVFWWSGY